MRLLRADGMVKLLLRCMRLQPAYPSSSQEPRNAELLLRVNQEGSRVGTKRRLPYSRLGCACPFPVQRCATLVRRGHSHSRAGHFTAPPHSRLRCDPEQPGAAQRV